VQQQFPVSGSLSDDAEVLETCGQNLREGLRYRVHSFRQVSIVYLTEGFEDIKLRGGKAQAHPVVTNELRAGVSVANDADPEDCILGEVTIAVVKQRC